MVPKDPSFTLWDALLLCAQESSPFLPPGLQSQERGVEGAFLSALAPRVFVESAEPFLTKPISHSNAGPPAPLKSKIKRDLSSSYMAHPFLAQQRGVPGPAARGRDCPLRAWTGGSVSFTLVLLLPAALPLQPSPPALLSAEGHFKWISFKTSEAIPFHIFKVHGPSIRLSFSSVHAFFQQVAQFVTPLLKLPHPSKLNYVPCLEPSEGAFAWGVCPQSEGSSHWPLCLFLGWGVSYLRRRTLFILLFNPNHAWNRTRAKTADCISWWWVHSCPALCSHKGADQEQCI